MSTILRNNSDNTPLPQANGMKIAIVAAEWNRHITDALLDGAIGTLHKAALNDGDIDTFRVPGTVELTFAAARLMKTGRYDAIIVLGCVIRGDTSHFDYVCQSVTEGVTRLNARAEVPVIFGVLTTDNEQQAIDRAGGKLGNKGAEAAECAIKMHDFALKSM